MEVPVADNLPTKDSGGELTQRNPDGLDDVTLHESILAGGAARFPHESFTMLVETGLSQEEALAALGYPPDHPLP